MVDQFADLCNNVIASCFIFITVLFFDANCIRFCVQNRDSTVEKAMELVTNTRNKNGKRCAGLYQCYFTLQQLQNK